jgi:hypothetical protein
MEHDWGLGEVEDGEWGYLRRQFLGRIGLSPRPVRLAFASRGLTEEV